MTFLRTSDDPTATTVVFQDSATLTGLLLAAAGVALDETTGSGVCDGIASLLVAALLAAVAVRRGRSNVRLPTSARADQRLARALVLALGDEPEVDAVVDILTIQTGTGQVLVRARLDVVDDVTGADLEPAPRHDEALRERVRQRYGPGLAERTVGEAALDGPPSPERADER